MVLVACPHRKRKGHRAFPSWLAFAAGQPAAARGKVKKSLPSTFFLMAGPSRAPPPEKGWLIEGAAKARRQKGRSQRTGGTRGITRAGLGCKGGWLWGWMRKKLSMP